MPSRFTLVLRCSWIALTLAGAPALAEWSETAEGSGTSAAPEAWNLHWQTTVIRQSHAAFPAAYAGPSSLDAARESATSTSATLYAGLRLGAGTELYVNPEFILNRGLSGINGLASLPNADVNHGDTPRATLGRARLFLRQTWGLGGDRVDLASDQNQLAGAVDAQRLVLTAGNFQAADLFDANDYASDPRRQFLTLALGMNAAWETPQNFGAALEWVQPLWTLRAALMTMPRNADDGSPARDIGRSQAVLVEAERHWQLAERPGVARLMAWRNRAVMGNWDEARASLDIGATRQLRVRHGFGLNLQQEIADDTGVFARLGWKDGQEEVLASGDVDRTLSAGIVAGGARWGRAADQLGIGMVGNGLAPPQRAWLAAGGNGYAIGDGALRYGNELAVEAWYSLNLVKGLDVALDLQRIVHPGYNRDRGPVSVWASRLHYQF